MEYLMTYGWAILIIAVVLGAIYSLGLFNGASLGPKASPGSCQVYRPNGPMTVQFISLAGECTNELPQYVSQYSGQIPSYVTIPAGGPIVKTTNTSIFMWINPSAIGTFQEGVFQSGDGCGSGNGYFIGIRSNALDEVTSPPGAGYTDWQPAGSTITPGVWTQIGFVWTYNSPSTSNLIMIINGKVISNKNIGAIQNPRTSNPLIGQSPTCWPGRNYNGSISNIQIYNTSLDTNSITALYLEGIGGAPINLQNLAAWFPLNGNANDYSGNLQNGATTALIYTNQWLSGYTIP